MRGLDPTLKAARLANYVVTLRKEILQLCHTAGVAHPSLVTTDHIEILDDQFGSRSVGEIFAYEKGWGLPSAADRAAIVELMTGADAQKNPSMTQKVAQLRSL